MSIVLVYCTLVTFSRAIPYIHSPTPLSPRRLELAVLLKHRASFILPGDDPAALSSDVTAVDYEQLTIDKLEDPLATEDMLTEYATLPEHSLTRVFLVSSLRLSLSLSLSVCL